jgi:hypothetical protein
MNFAGLGLAGVRGVSPCGWGNRALAWGQRGLHAAGAGFDGYQAWQRYQSGDDIGAALALARAGANGWLMSRACFTGRMLLDWEGGRRRADFVRKGDRLWSRSEFDPEGPLALKVVEEVFVRLAAIWYVQLPGQVLETTAEHPFDVWGKGWTPTAMLNVGDWLRTRSGGWVRVEAVGDTGTVQTVYNFRLADYHTYFVSADEDAPAVWAHNAYEAMRDAEGNGVLTAEQVQQRVAGMLQAIGHTPEQAAAIAQRYAGTVKANGKVRVLPGNELHDNLLAYIQQGGGTVQPPGNWVEPPGWRLPENGVWTGVPGHSDFIPDNPTALGISLGEAIPFRGGRVDFSRWAEYEFISQQVLTGDRNIEPNAMHQGTARYFNEIGLTHPEGGVWTGTYVKAWASRNELAFHHAGDDVVQLVPYSLHGARRRGIPGITHMEFDRGG